VVTVFTLNHQVVPSDAPDGQAIGTVDNATFFLGVFDVTLPVAVVAKLRRLLTTVQAVHGVSDLM
jgi:hypothetical protein